MRRLGRWTGVAAIAILPFTLTACPGDDEGNVEDVVPGDENEGVDVDTDTGDGEADVDVEG